LAVWLQYAYFPHGGERVVFVVLLNSLREARAALVWVRAHPTQVYLSSRTAASLKSRIDATLVTLRATAIVESPRFRRQAAAMDLDVSDIGRHKGWALFSRGLDQAARGETARAGRSLAALQAIASEPDEEGDNGSTRGYLGIMAQMLEGAIAQRSGKPDEGLRLVAAAATAFDALPFDFGPPATVKPPRELLGEMLLAAGRRQEALAEFDLALKSAPKRALSVAGRERALVK